MKAYNMRMPGETVVEEKVKMLVAINFLEQHVNKNQRKVFTMIIRYS